MVTIVAHPETGALFTPTSKEGWSKCQLAETAIVVNNGVITQQKRVAFALVSNAVAEALAGLKNGSKFPVNGKIVRKTTSEPQFTGHKEVVNPSTGDPMGYYSTYKFTTDLNESDIDERVAIEVVAEVTAANNPLV